jgi:hypothetical protein
MTKITIKKTEEEETYRQITTTHTFEVNGKKVRVYCYDKQDMQMEDYENDTTVDENDIAKLTDEEHEIFGEDLNDWLDLKVGELQEVDGYEE